MQFGVETYGRVKVVGTTPVVTKFFNVMIFPLIPLQSVYLLGQESKFEGVPMVAGVETVTIYGFPLARLSWISVIWAYMRAIGATLFVVGTCGFVFLGMTYLNDDRIPPENFVLGAQILGSILVIGTGLGLVTYLLEPRASRREVEIRLACGAVMGIFADLAQVTAAAAEKVSQEMASFGDLETEQMREQDVETLKLARQLTLVRARLASQRRDAGLERETDDLLSRLGAYGFFEN